MTPAPEPRGGWFRPALLSVLAHVGVILVPASWLTLAGGAPRALPGRGESIPVSLYAEAPAPGPVSPDAGPPLASPRDPFAGTLPPVPDAYRGNAPRPGPGAPAPVPPAPGGAAGSADPRHAPASPTAGDDAYRPPRLLVGALPVLGEDLEVQVELHVNDRGEVADVRILTPGLDPEIQAAVRRSARAMRFVPARRGDRTVDSWFPMTFRN